MFVKIRGETSGIGGVFHAHLSLAAIRLKAKRHSVSFCKSGHSVEQANHDKPHQGVFHKSLRAESNAGLGPKNSRKWFRSSIVGNGAAVKSPGYCRCGL